MSRLPTFEERRALVERRGREQLRWLLEVEAHGVSIVNSLRLALGAASAWRLLGLSAEIRAALADRGYSGSGKRKVCDAAK